MSTTVQMKTIAELEELCKNIGITLEVIPMYRKDYLEVRFEPHLSTMWVEYTPSLEKRAVRAALKELAFEGLVPEK